MGPRQVFILRHAEKPADKSNTHLSPIGIERARKLVAYFQANAHLFGNVVAIYACAPYKEDSSTRAEETMQFLADHWQIEIITKYTREKKSDEGRRDAEGHRAPVKSSQSDMAEKILSKSKYNGKTVIICWEHKTIPDLIVSLGGPDIDDWGKVYDRIVELKYSEEGQVTDKIEHKMPF